MKTAIQITLFVCFVLSGQAVFRAGAQSSTPPGQGTGQTPLLQSPNAISLVPMDSQPIDPLDTQQLDGIFATALTNASLIPPGTDDASQGRSVDNGMRSELETFVADHPNSAWTPAVRNFLGRGDLLRSGYTHALNHYRRAWLALKGSWNSAGQGLQREATAGLAKSLILNGRLDEFDALLPEMGKMVETGPVGVEWRWALKMREWAKQNPAEYSKCGILCLDQLGRLTQSGSYISKAVLTSIPPTNGFTVADLVNMGRKAGLRVRAVSTADFTTLPVPCVVHLHSDHYVLIRDRRETFYEVYDPAASGPRWLAAEDIAREASGCLLVSDAAPSTAAAPLLAMALNTAVTYRGRITVIIYPFDYSDPGPCPPPGDTANPPGCPPGPLRCPPNPADSSSSCSTCSGGMPKFYLSQPFLNAWIEDIPLQYHPAYGPDVTVRLAYNANHFVSTADTTYWQGALLGNCGATNGAWACSLLSFVGLNMNLTNADLLLPGGGWATFAFASTTNLVSSVNYMHNTTLQKTMSGTNVTNLILNQPDGSLAVYGLLKTNPMNPGYGLYFITNATDPVGYSTTFAYDTNCLLTTVTAADGAHFNLHYTNSILTNYITSITTSYGPAVYFQYDTNHYGVLTAVTDAAGITSQFYYVTSTGGPPAALITPYGTTYMNPLGMTNAGDSQGMFTRTAQLTQPDGSVEFYALMNTYASNDWPNFATNQVPTNTPVGSLDTGTRQQNNTFYWNAEQFLPFVNTNLNNFNWTMFKQSRIRHWLEDTNTSNDQYYAYYNTLSREQAHSPDVVTTDCQISC